MNYNWDSDQWWAQLMVLYFSLANWKIKRSLLPRKCRLSGKKLWMKQCMYGTRVITGPGDPVIEHYWVDQQEFMWHKLKYGY